MIEVKNQGNKFLVPVSNASRELRTLIWNASLLLKLQHIIGALLAFTANSAAQSSTQTDIHSAIVVIDTSNNA